LSRATIFTEPLLVAVVGGTVTVGIGVTVVVGLIGVDVSVPVGGGVSVGNAVETGKVGNGANVTVPKLNKAVGVATVPSLGKTLGLGSVVEELRDLNGNKLISVEQRQQKARTNTPGKSILPVGPC